MKWKGVMTCDVSPVATFNTKHCQRHNEPRVLILELEFISLAKKNLYSVEKKIQGKEWR